MPLRSAEEVFNRLVDAGTANRLRQLGRVHLLVDNRAVPGEDGGRRGNGGNLCEDLLAQLHTNLSEFLALIIDQPHTTIDLVTQEAILSDQRVIAQPEVVVHRF